MTKYVRRMKSVETRGATTGDPSPSPALVHRSNLSGWPRASLSGYPVPIRPVLAHRKRPRSIPPTAAAARTCQRPSHDTPTMPLYLYQMEAKGSAGQRRALDHAARQKTGLMYGDGRPRPAADWPPAPPAPSLRHDGHAWSRGDAGRRPSSGVGRPLKGTRRCSSPLPRAVASSRGIAERWPWRDGSLKLPLVQERMTPDARRGQVDH